MEQCSALKIHMLFIWRADIQYLSLQVVPVLECQTLAWQAVLRSSKGQRTVAFLTEPTPQHRDTFVCRGLPVILHCGRTIIFYSTGSRPSQTTQSQPPMNSLVMRAWWASITTRFSRLAMPEHELYPPTSRWCQHWLTTLSWGKVVFFCPPQELETCSWL